MLISGGGAQPLLTGLCGSQCSSSLSPYLVTLSAISVCWLAGWGLRRWRCWCSPHFQPSCGAAQPSGPEISLLLLYSWWLCRGGSSTPPGWLIAWRGRRPGEPRSRSCCTRSSAAPRRVSCSSRWCHPRPPHLQLHQPSAQSNLFNFRYTPLTWTRPGPQSCRMRMRRSRLPDATPATPPPLHLVRYTIELIFQILNSALNPNNEITASLKLRQTAEQLDYLAQCCHHNR